MRIIARLNVGGPALHCLLLSENLAQHGYETVLVTGSPEIGEASYEAIFNVEIKNFRLVRLPRLRRSLSIVGDVTTLFRLYRLIRKERPDIVHTHTAKAGLLGRIAARAAGVPIIVHTFHGHVLTGYFSNGVSKLVQLIERQLAKHTTAIVTLSQSLKEELSVKFRVAPSVKFKIVPLGRVLGPFWETPRFSGRLRRELKLTDPSTQVIGIIGRLVPIKCHHLLIEAFAQVSKPNLHLVIIGEGPLLAKCRELVEKFGIESRVHFLGWRSDLTSLYSDLDFSVLCSRNEGTPLSIIESFAAGCPVLSTAVGGVPDLFTKGRDEERVPSSVTFCNEGILVPADSVAALMEGINLLSHNEELRSRMSNASRHKSREYSDSALINRIAGLYGQLLRNQECF